jgi:hypothetical protein
MPFYDDESDMFVSFRFLTLLAPAFLIGLCGITYAATVEPNQNWELSKSSSGQEYMDVRWAVQSASDVGDLRVPRAYADPFMVAASCRPFGPSVDLDCKSNHEDVVLLRATLPGLSPFAQGATTPGDLVGILLESLVDRPEHPTPEQFIAAASVRTAKFMSRWLIQGEDEFGLHRLVPRGLKPLPGELVNPEASATFYYDGADPGSATTYLLCQPPLVAMPSLHDSCDQWIAIPGINAVAKLHYDARHLEEWRSLVNRIPVIISSFYRGK